MLNQTRQAHGMETLDPGFLSDFAELPALSGLASGKWYTATWKMYLYIDKMFYHLSSSHGGFWIFLFQLHPKNSTNNGGPHLYIPPAAVALLLSSRALIQELCLGVFSSKSLFWILPQHTHISCQGINFLSWKYLVCIYTFVCVTMCFMFISSTGLYFLWEQSYIFFLHHVICCRYLINLCWME